MVSLGTLNPHSITQIYWGSAGPLFSFDYDDTYSSNYGTGVSGNAGSSLANCTLTAGPSAPEPQWQNFCAPVGNFQVSFSGTLSGSGDLDTASVAAVFAGWDVNGNFTGWEGLDPMGWPENALYDVHSGTVSGVLANIYVGTPETVPQSPSGTPEPQTWMLILTGAATGMVLRRKQRGQSL